MQSSRGFEGRAMVPLRDAVVQRNANVAALRPVGLTSNKAVSVDAELDSKIAELESQFLDLSASLDDPGLSEAKRFASKKNLAKIRANILRLNREKDSSSSARYS